ncbi:hypothetical protein SHAM105786_07310 [Shewanella amazonensis]|uniref:DUF304 domain-containing protein n=1 Tax=Shewanella amazonensis (strain ATCC BAA-1098 / SB2B) TaxID=326297 RepID=A1S3H2_SHEAM|nr:hypothetical protein [Shewanella amazonensis]ABL98928.1 hypothetical protein Sama_0720 [Shewanella amazonensis SB2B]
MKWIKESDARGSLVLGNRVALVILGMIPLIPTLIFSGIGFNGNSRHMLLWALTASFSWHCLFANHRVTIDKGRGLLKRRISSLYTLLQVQVKLEDIQAFVVTRRGGDRNKYQLLVLGKQGQRERLLVGFNSQMMEAGKHLAEFCDKPLVED